MMRKVVFAWGLIVALATCGRASIFIGVPFPGDDGVVKGKVLGLFRDNTPMSADALADRKAVRAVNERLRGHTLHFLRTAFGPVQDSVPAAGYVLPAAEPAGAGFSGLVSQVDADAGRDKVRSFFVEIPEVGGALVFQFANPNFPADVVLYLKDDGKVPRLEKVEDFPVRHAWDAAAIARVAKAIDAAEGQESNSRHNGG